MCTHDEKPLRLTVLASSLVIMTLALSGCDSAPEGSDYAAKEEAVQASSEEVYNLPSTEAADENGLTIRNISGDTEQKLSSEVTDIKIAGKELVINAEANFKVEDVVKSNRDIETLTRQQGGYVARSRIANVETESQTFTSGDKEIRLVTYHREANMTVRIPRQKVKVFMEKLQDQVVFLNEQQFTAEDVTLDIYRKKLEAELNGEKARELQDQRLKSNDDKGQGSNVEAINATYIARQQQELARLQQLEIADRVKFSTIDLTFIQPANTYKEVSKNLQALIKEEQPSFISQTIQAVKNGWEVLILITLGTIELWWLWLLLIFIYFGYRLIRSLFKKTSR